MPASFRNLIDTNALGEALTSGDYSGVFKNKKTNRPKYIKGYEQESAIETLARKASSSLPGGANAINQFLGIDDKKLDDYDPYNTTNSKKELFWNTKEDVENQKGVDGKAIQREYDEDTNTFKRSLYTQPELGSSEGAYGESDFWYEDPTYPAFELFFDENSPFFTEDDDWGSLTSFLSLYSEIDPIGYQNRSEILDEFRKVFFKIFEKSVGLNSHRNVKNKSYYITKIGGLENLTKKISNFGEDKITITLNEDVAYFAYYISELYNNLVYSYAHKRYAFPENVIRFNLTIKINDIRSFQVPERQGTDYKYSISNKSYILYTLHDCTFDFFDSRNYNPEIEVGGYNASWHPAPSTLSFNIYYKSVSRSGTFPLIKNSLLLHPWETPISSKISEEGTGDEKIDTIQKYFDTLNREKKDTKNEPKGYLNGLLSNAAQTVVNAAANYADNLETRLREVKGSAVNSLLSQFRSASNINKIEPDNVYKSDFNDRASAKNAAKSAASSLLNDLEESIKQAGNI